MRPLRRHSIDFSLGGSLGYLVRDANRAFQRLLERRISPHGVTRGQWYFLRVLWEEDGLSQRELSARVGMMEPTTVIALRGMEKAGLIRRVRSTDDRRDHPGPSDAEGAAAARPAPANFAGRQRSGPPRASIPAQRSPSFAASLRADDRRTLDSRFEPRAETLHSICAPDCFTTAVHFGISALM